MNIIGNNRRQSYADNMIAFKGEREKKFLLNALENHCEYYLIKGADDGVFKGITPEELNSVEIKEAIKKRKAKAIFEGSIKAVNLALEIIKESFGK